MAKNNINILDMVQDIMDKTKTEVDNMAPVNILVAGKTGVGKSTLINSLFRENLASTGVGKPVTAHLTKISKEGIPINLYDTRGLELDAKVQKEVMSDIEKLYKENENTNDALHVAYYCINGNSNRIEDLEIDLIKRTSERIPVIIVLTQSIGEPAEEFKAYLEEMDLPIEAIINVMADSYKISEDVVIEEYGLKELIAKTLDVIPEEAERAFNNAQHADIIRKAQSAKVWAKRYTKTAFGIGFSPVPMSDAALLVPMQVTLIAHITAIFGISLDKSTIVSLVAGLLGTTGATTAGRAIVSNIVKLIPGLGTVAGGFISGGTAAALTSALAISYIEILTRLSMAEKDGKAPDLSNIEELMKEKFSEALKNRKNVEDVEEVEKITDEEFKEIEENVEKNDKIETEVHSKVVKANWLDRAKGFINKKR